MSGWRRRDVLAMAAAAVPACWWPRSLLAAQSDAESIPRLVCIGLDLSLRPENFFPSAPGPDYDLTPLLQPLAKRRGQFTVFSQLDHPGVSGGHNAVQAYLSGVRSEQAAGFPLGMMSLDQWAASRLGQATRFPSLSLGVGGGDAISWTRAGIAVPKIDKPRDAFDRLFRPPPAAKREGERRRMAADRLVADLIAQDARRLSPQLDAWDRDKLDEFQTALADVEAGLKRSEVWLDRPYPTTDAEPPSTTSDGCLEDVRAMYDVIALALECDATRVVSFNIGYNLPVANRIAGVNQSYHDLSHTGHDPDKLRQLAVIETALMGEFERFLARLDGVRNAAGRSLLDQTVVLFGSGMGNASSHSNRNLPILVAGGGLKHGRHVFFEKRGRLQTPLCNLYVTLLQRLGLEVDRFGTSDGNLNELLV